MNSANPTQDYLEVVTQKIHDSRSDILNPAERYLDRVASLPPAPMLVTELLTLFREPDRDVDQVVQLISYEPSLTAQILRTCNSACFAGEQPPGDIFEAVSRLGFYQVYCLVVSLFGAKARSMEGAGQGVDVEELWRHSVAAAVSASVVEEEAGQSKGAAFTAGLLHDIGKLVLASVEREPYAGLFQQAKEQGAALAALEQSAFGIDHAELGGELMRRWNLPPDVVAAVRHHHQFAAAAPYEQLTASVQAADLLAHQLFAEDWAGTDLLASSTAALYALGLTPDDLPRLLAKAQAEMEKVKGLLEM
jgi:putative nucleotidyltransferase with HDIG domain